MITKSDSKLGIPPYFKERCVVRVKDHKFGPNSKDNPMITVNFELCGIPNNTGSCDIEYDRGGVKYIIGGLNINSKYFTLVDKAINFYAEFWEKANGKTFEGVDESNPDMAFLDDLCMEVIVTGQQREERKTLSPEEKEALIAEGKPAIGEPILDGDGEKITRSVLDITMWLKRYTGEVPTPF